MFKITRLSGRVILSMQSKQPPSDHHLINKESLARHLTVSLATIERWQEARRIPFYRFGPRCVRFHLLKVLEALEKMEIPANAHGLRRRRRQRVRTKKFYAEQLMLPLRYRDLSQLEFELEIALVIALGLDPQ